jgi:hypothetical protein
LPPQAHSRQQAHPRITVDDVCTKNGVIRRPNGLKLYGNILALPGIILKITGAGVENIIGRSQNITLLCINGTVPILGAQGG